MPAYRSLIIIVIAMFVSACAGMPEFDLTPDPAEATVVLASEPILLEEVPVTLILPAGYTLTKSNEANRRGSFVSYDFTPPDNFQTPYLQEIQFFTEGSIRDFIATCIGDYPCFFGDYPDLERYFRQRQAFDQRQRFEEYELLQIGEWFYYISNRPCEGDTCILREYTTFLSGGIKVDIWSILEDDSQTTQSDELFSHLLLQE